MLGLTMLDVLIGLVFIYFITSVTCSTIVEAISAQWRWRSHNLERALRSMLSGEKSGAKGAGPAAAQSPNSAITKLKRHPIIASTSKSVDALPSYLTAGNFASAVLDMIAPEPGEGAGVQAAGTSIARVAETPASRFAAIRARALALRSAATAQGRASIAEVHAFKIDLLDHPHLQQIVRHLIESGPGQAGSSASAAGSDADQLTQLRKGLEKWFDDTMDRASGWYKQRAQLFILIFAAVFSIALNLDSIAIAQRLAMSDSARDKVVAMATAEQPAGAAQDPAKPPVTGEQLKAKWAEVARAGLPIGWENEKLPTDAGDRAFWVLTKLFGLALTVGAVSMGAPFWFDVLGKLTNLRAAGVKPERADAARPTTPDSGAGGTPPAGPGAAPSPSTPPAPPRLPSDYWSAPARRSDIARFDPGAGPSTPANAAVLARAALLAYQPPDAIVRTLTSVWGADAAKVRVFSAAGQQAFVAVLGPTKGGDPIVLVSFRGTVPAVLETVIADARIALTSLPAYVPTTQASSVSVHSGFLSALDALAADIDALVDQAAVAQPAARVFITGHSLGAAMGTLYAARRINQGKGDAIGGLCTFGSPRVGDEAFVGWLAQKLGGRHARYVNNEDVVTRVAPREMGYAHLEPVMFIDSGGRIDPAAGGWVRFLGTLIHAAEDFRALARLAVADHSMELYVRQLDNLASA